MRKTIVNTSSNSNVPFTTFKTLLIEQVQTCEKLNKMSRFFKIITIVIPFFISGCVSEVSKQTESTPVVYYEDEVNIQKDSLTNQISAFIQSQPYIDTQKLEVCVYDLSSARYIYTHRDIHPIVPASCIKVLTTLAALDSLGMNHQYESRLYIDGTIKKDTLFGKATFKMDDDPLFESFSELVDALRAKGVSCIKGLVSLDLTREDTLRAHSTAKTWDIPYSKLPMLLRGKKYVERHLQYELANKGIKVDTDSTIQIKGKTKSIVSVHNKMTDVITPMLIHSSNVKADALTGHLSVGEHSTANGAEALMRFCSNRLHVDTSSLGFKINDGSGLSPDNRLNARFLVSLLRYAFDKDEYFEYLVDSALVTPGIPERAGSLKTRMYNSKCVGRLFCKTGTMVTVGASGLMGYVQTKDNDWLAFSILSSDSPVADSRILQDKFCKLLVELY